MNDSLYVIIVIVLLALLFLADFLKRQVTIRRNQFCPHCQHKMEVKWKSRDVPPEEESARMGRTRMKPGTVKQYWSVMSYSNCGYEFKL